LEELEEQLTEKIAKSTQNDKRNSESRS